MLMSDRRRIDGRLFFELAKDPPVASAAVIVSGTSAAVSAPAPLDSVIVDVPDVEAGLSFSDDEGNDDASKEEAAADALADSTVTVF